MNKLPVLIICFVVCLQCKQDLPNSWEIVERNGEEFYLSKDSSEQILKYTLYGLRDSVLSEKFGVRKSSGHFYTERYSDVGVMQYYFAGVDTTILFAAKILENGVLAIKDSDPYDISFPDDVNSYCVGDTLYVDIVSLLVNVETEIKLSIGGEDVGYGKYSLPFGDTIHLGFLGSNSLIDTFELVGSAINDKGIVILSEHYSELVVHKEVCD